MPPCVSVTPSNKLSRYAPSQMVPGSIKIMLNGSISLISQAYPHGYFTCIPDFYAGHHLEITDGTTYK